MNFIHFINVITPTKIMHWVQSLFYIVEIFVISAVEIGQSLQIAETSSILRYQSSIVY